MGDNIRQLNVIGTGCPMNFVLIKTTLDRIPAGELLRVQLDKASVGFDVAESLRNSGYEVVSIEEKADHTEALVRKRPQTAWARLPHRARNKQPCGSNRRHRV
jgi:TusA-related sulfurtransferase